MDRFAEDLGAAIDGRGVSLVWLRDQLVERGNPVSLTTLSYWRSGRRRPERAGSLAALAVIEDLLGLPAGHLESLLDAPRRRRSAELPRLPFGDEKRRTAIEETVAALGTATMSDLRVLTAQVVGDVDGTGRLRRCASRVLTQVTAGTVEEIPYLEIVAEPTAVPPVVTVVAGADVTRHHHHASGQVSGFVFETERPVTAPDASLVEWTVEFPPSYPDLFECSYSVSREAREVVVWVRFDPDRLPAWIEEYTHDDADVRPVELGTGTTVHAVRTRFGPGEVGFRWGF